MGTNDDQGAGLPRIELGKALEADGEKHLDPSSNSEPEFDTDGETMPESGQDDPGQVEALENRLNHVSRQGAEWRAEAIRAREYAEEQQKKLDAANRRAVMAEDRVERQDRQMDTLIETIRRLVDSL